MNGHEFTEDEFRAQMLEDLKMMGVKDVVITSVFATDYEVVGYFDSSSHGSSYYGMMKTEKWVEENGPITD
jgi:hypothetical protein